MRHELLALLLAAGLVAAGPSAQAQAQAAEKESPSELARESVERMLQALEAAQHLARLRWNATAAVAGLLLAVAAGGLTWARGRIRTDFRARNQVERAVRISLVLSSTVAVLTTIGIVLSLIFEALRFFAEPKNVCIRTASGGPA